MSTEAKRLLGTILVDAKVLAEARLAEALDRQHDSGQRLGAILVEMGLVDEQTIVAALGVQTNLTVIDLRTQSPDDDAAAMVPEGVARALSATPVRRTPQGFEVAVSEPLDGSRLARLEGIIGEHVVMRLAPADSIRQTIESLYTLHSHQSSSPSQPDPDLAGIATPRDDGHEVLHALVSDALLAGASDVHIEFRPLGTRVRYRIDGVLREVPSVPTAFAQAVVRHAKVLARPSRVGRRQRSQFTMTVDGRDLLVYVGEVVTVRGARVWLGLMNDEAPAFRRLDELGMPTALRRSFTSALHGSSGLVVIAGPSGSGRTTTAFAAVAEIDAPGRRVVMVQRVVSRVLSGITQVEIGARPVIPTLLAAVEESAADAVVLDEVEGVRVVRAALRMAQSGILVVMTMTLPDAAAATAQVLHAGVAPFPLSSMLRAVLGQRLEWPENAAAHDSRTAAFELMLR